jgi:hypothetical protein
MSAKKPAGANPTWKVHDHGKVSFEGDEKDNCEVLSYAYSYERLGLYYLTNKSPQHFCDLHLIWGTKEGARWWSAAYYTAPGDSALTMDTTRSMIDADTYSGRNEGIAYDSMGNAIMDAQQGFSDKLNLTDGGYVVYFGDPRPDAELRNEAKTFQHGMEHFKDRIGRKRNLECWLLGPVSLVEGDKLWGSFVAKLQGRFEKNLGYQPCTLLMSHYVQDGSISDGNYHAGVLEGAWEETSAPTEGFARRQNSQIIKDIRHAVVEMPLPAFARGVVWKLEQHEVKRTMCQAKAMSG